MTTLSERNSYEVWAELLDHVRQLDVQLERLQERVETLEARFEPDGVQPGMTVG
jgi:hypothetical protein